jgi:TRAP-type C4-dicarboxylate transport system permease small subunit
VERKQSLAIIIGNGLLHFLEVHMSAAAFGLMFIIFIIQVVFRYVLGNPLAWTHEISVFAFIWTILFGASLARKKHSHVSFGLLYDRMPAGLKRICRIVGDTLISASLLVLLIPSIEYIMFLKDRKSVALRIPFSYVYAPFLLFLLLIVWHSFRDIWYEIFRSEGSGPADKGNL